MKRGWAPRGAHLFIGSRRKSFGGRAAWRVAGDTSPHAIGPAVHGIVPRGQSIHTLHPGNGPRPPGTRARGSGKSPAVGAIEMSAGGREASAPGIEARRPGRQARAPGIQCPGQREQPLSTSMQARTENMQPRVETMWICAAAMEAAADCRETGACRESRPGLPQRAPVCGGARPAADYSAGPGSNRRLVLNPGPPNAVEPPIRNTTVRPDASW